MSTLYDLKGKYATLLAMAQENDLPDEMLADTLDSLKEAIKDKSEGYVQVIKQLQADTDTIDSEIKRLQERKRSYQGNVQRLKSTLVEAMHATDTPKIKSPLFTIWTQQSASVQIKDNNFKNLSPDYLVEQDPRPDRKKIAKDLKAGKEVVGAELKYSESLRIR